MKRQRRELRETRALHAEFVGLLAGFGLDTVGIFRELSESLCDKVFFFILFNYLIK